MPIDKVCGKNVSEKTQFKTKYGERGYFFCKKVCLDSFVNNPIKYVDRSGAAASLAGTPKVKRTNKKKRSRP